jgi:tetratricopeptide (TPR) repeat protein
VAGRNAAPRRRLIAATFGLELAGESLNEKWWDVRQVIEWGCRLLRRDSPREVERLWYLASIAVAEGAIDTQLLKAPGQQLGLTNHLAHAHARFADDSRFPFSDVVANELLVNEPRRDEPWEPDATLKARAPFESQAAATLRGRAYLRRQIERLREFQTDRTVGLEARLRTGRLLYVLHEPAEALVEFNEVLKNTDDPFLVHLAHLFSARAHEQLGDRNLAARAYRQALEAVPGAQAASMQFAVIQSADGRPTEAVALMKSSFALQPRDPWRLYAHSSYRFWSQYMSALRREIWP